MGCVRLLLAACVFASHAVSHDLALLPGQVAVQAFFILSGFFMTLVLTGKYGPGRFGLFIGNRLLRLLPVYLVVLAASLAALKYLDVGPFTGWAGFASDLTAGPAVLAAGLWTNLGILGQDLLFLLAIGPQGGLVPSFHCGPADDAFRLLLVPQAWSLSTELFFYLIAPFILRRSIFFRSGLLLASLGLRLALHLWDPDCDLLARRLFPAELWLFLLGSLAHTAYVRLADRAWLARLGLPAFLALALAVMAYPHLPPALAWPAFLLLSAAACPAVFAWTRASRLDRFWAELSYPFYLVHFLILACFEEFDPEYGLPPVVLASLAAALLLRALVEVPVDRWRRRRLGPGRGRASVSAPAPA
jgi:peptidoglycan/LPS O-acetylase OafA/YrhL